MVKKLFIMFIFGIMSFTSINAQVPNDYQAINFDNLTYINSNTQASEQDNVYKDLWSFINFRQSYIIIDGNTIVANGESIPDASFGLRVTGGQYFELEYDDLIYRFTLEQVEMGDIQQTIFSNVLLIIPTGNRTIVPSGINVTLYLPDNAFIYEADASESFLALLTGYGLNNPVGLLILFFVVILGINIALIYLKVPSVVYVSVNLAVGSGFIFFNFIPAWAGFIFLAVMILFLILSMRGSKI
jgi:hypothetical protein